MSASDRCPFHTARESINYAGALTRIVARMAISEDEVSAFAILKIADVIKK